MKWDQIIHLEIIVLILCTAVWCFFHSFLITSNTTNFFKKKLGSDFKYYRIFYNLFSLISLIAVLFYEKSIRQDIIFNWSGYYQIFRVILVLLALSLFYLGSKQYSFSDFIGINQIKNQSNKLAISHSGELNITGIHKVIRHPWYLGTLIIIWLRNISISIVWMNIIFSIYLVIGAFIEERKLIQEFGQAYKDYQKKVSMLFPIKWLAKIKK